MEKTGKETTKRTTDEEMKAKKQVGNAQKGAKARQSSKKQTARHSETHHESMRERILYTTAKSFLEKGFTETTIREIAKDLGVSTGAIINFFRSKEDILCELVKYVLEGQFQATAKFLNGITDDKILFYAVETTLQLHMAESSEHIRNLYAAAYSLPKSSDIIQHAITSKLEDIFKEHLPNLKTLDFYKLEIASGGIMRGFLTIPCTMWFTMEQKIEAFLETTFLVYKVPQQKIDEAIAFVSRFDFKTFAEQTIQSMMSFLNAKTSL